MKNYDVVFGTFGKWSLGKWPFVLLVVVSWVYSLFAETGFYTGFPLKIIILIRTTYKNNRSSRLKQMKNYDFKKGTFGKWSLGKWQFVGQSFN